MKYPTISIQGNILAAELLEELEREAPHQNPASFGLPAGSRVKDEIARAWGEARLQWQVFQSKRERIKEGATGTSETRQFWILPLLDTLGYRPTVATAETVAGQTYAVSHRDEEIGGFPIHVMGISDNLDKRRTTGGPRLSPHSLVQEYINLTEHLYAVVSNGLKLRLLRDSSRLTRLSYVEFDLVKMMDDEVFPDFAVMYRLLHRSRVPQRMDGGDESILERYHQLALEAGAAIRSRLSAAVKQGLERLGCELLQHPANSQLRGAFEAGEIDAQEYYNQLLRLIYRILFLLVIEERDLVFADGSESTSKGGTSFKEIYREHYSVSRWRTRAEARQLVDGRQEDSWKAVFDTFRLFSSEEHGARLGIKPLVGQLFGPEATPALEGTSARNQVFLFTLDQLTRFQDKQGLWVRVNYASLNVEEFGSVYEGLLEFSPVVSAGVSTQSGRGWAFSFDLGNARATTGSHYTPDELVRPLIEHALDPVIERKLDSEGGTREADEKALLSLKICDVACGSGHFLLAAARRVALVLARRRTLEEQPAPEAIRRATRDVISHCIYGVDINPMAVELCKVALWLEAHNPSKPLTFLDHRIRCGDAVVGVARYEDLSEGIPDGAFKTLSGDDKEVGSELRRRNKTERKTRGIGTGSGLQLALGDELGKGVQSLAEQFAQLDQFEDHSSSDVKKKEVRYRELAGMSARRFRELADVKTAQFFLPKKWDGRSALCTDLEYRRALGGAATLDPLLAGVAASVSRVRRFFHWFVEFPDVMAAGGFDCILGNPPFLGNRKITGTHGAQYLNFLTHEYLPAGAVDLVVYFQRRSFSLLAGGGCLGQIATDTIAQGNARVGGLQTILKSGGNINFAESSKTWPGEAAVIVALLAIYKGDWGGDRLLNGRLVSRIDSALSDEELSAEPRKLKANARRSFMGSVVLGKGFLLSVDEGQSLVNTHPEYADVVVPYLNGKDINSSPRQEASRYVISFGERSLEEARKFSEVFRKVEQEVLPQRRKVRRKAYREKWWRFAEPCTNLYRSIEGQARTLVVAQTTKYLAPVFVKTAQVFSSQAIVFAFDDYFHLGLLSSSVHESWVLRYTTFLGGTMRYTPSKVFETFPFPSGRSSKIADAAAEFERLRDRYMREFDLALTAFYNRFHDSGSVDPRLSEIRQAFCKLDKEVVEAYGWESIELNHGFREVDRLPENDRLRFGIDDEARKEVIRRLLRLNLQRATDESQHSL